jgi:hypothetical protein
MRSSRRRNESGQGFAVGGRVIDSCSFCERSNRLKEVNELRRNLGAWEVAGFPGTWDDWWSQWWDKDVAEHNEWLVWLHSDSHMSFWDWQERQKAAPVTETKCPK